MTRKHVKNSRSKKAADKKAIDKKTAVKKAQEENSQEKDSRKGSRFLSRWFLIVPVVIALFAVLSLSWYYEPAKIWYRETRQERVLRETLAGIQEYNEYLRDELASLETTAGIQEHAQRELNFIVDGDYSIVVTRDGVPISEPRTTREAAVTSIPENAQPFGVWTDFLDTFFGIE